VNRKLAAYDEAGRLALEVPKTVATASRPQACYDAAQVLARIVDQVGSSDKLSRAERDYLTRKYLTRTVLLLREAVDSGPALANKIKGDPDIKALESRPQFQAIMNNLVDVVEK
jgi:hypothetical protein